MKHLLSILFWTCSMLSFSHDCMAQLILRNNCNQDISVAIKYISAPNSSFWTTKGRFAIGPGKNEIVIGDLLLVNRYIYYYAHTTDGKYTWSGETDVCVSRDRFDYYDFFTKEECPEVLPFIKIDIGNTKKLTYIINCPEEDRYIPPTPPFFRKPHE